jgi:REP element-mobilizing transposase RayT
MGAQHHRLPREHYEGRVWASFTVCIENRKAFFVDAGIVKVFVDFLKEVVEKHDFRAIYCFMPDHLHLVLLGGSDVLLGGSDRSSVLRGIEDFKQATGYWLKSQPPRIRWQKGFYDRIIRARELGIIVRYVLDNPVRRRLVREWRDYPFIGSIGMDLETFLQELGPE